MSHNYQRALFHLAQVFHKNIDLTYPRDMNLVPIAVKSDAHERMVCGDFDQENLWLTARSTRLGG